MTDFLKTNRREVYRYMGLRGSKPDKAVEQMTEGIISDLAKSINPKFCARDTSLEISGSLISFETFSVESSALAKNLSGCEAAILIAATLGSEADRIIEKYTIISPSKAVAAQAAAAAMIEQYADEICAVLKEEENASGFYLRPRFSPGYGDLSLDCQESFLTALDARRKIGLCLTGGGLMTPVKSITAVIGKTRNPQSCHIEKCSGCKKLDCPFRKNE